MCYMKILNFKEATDIQRSIPDTIHGYGRFSCCIRVADKLFFEPHR